MDPLATGATLQQEDILAVKAPCFDGLLAIGSSGCSGLQRVCATQFNSFVGLKVRKLDTCDFEGASSTYKCAAIQF